MNPSMLPGRIFGPGGFPVIAGGAPKTYFAGTFTAGQLKIDIINNKMRIQQDGSIVKFVESVFKVVFSGSQAIKYGKETVYITERATFRLTNRGIVLRGCPRDRHRQRHNLQDGLSTYRKLSSEGNG